MNETGPKGWVYIIKTEKDSIAIKSHSKICRVKTSLHPVSRWVAPATKNTEYREEREPLVR